MNFEEKLSIYAELLVTHGANIQHGQIVNVSTEACHRDFAIKIVEAAYKKGAKYVGLDLADPRLTRVRVLNSAEEDLSYVPPYLTTKYTDLVENTAANIKIIGSEDPDIIADLDPKHINTLRLSQHMAVKYFYDEGIGKSRVHWTLAAAATPKWAKKVFPDMEEATAVERLWEEIFRICRVDKPDCLGEWRAHNERLHSRGERSLR